MTELDTFCQVPLGNCYVCWQRSGRSCSFRGTLFVARQARTLTMLLATRLLSSQVDGSDARASTFICQGVPYGLIGPMPYSLLAHPPLSGAPHLVWPGSNCFSFAFALLLGGSDGSGIDAHNYNAAWCKGGSVALKSCRPKAKAF